MSQVIYTNIYNPNSNSHEPRGKKDTKSKWFKTIKDWIETKATGIGQSIDQWSLTRTNNARMQKKKRIAARMQTSNKKRGLRSLMAFTVVAMQASKGIHDNAVSFDTDSAPVGVDNRCTGCISNRIEDFEGPLIESNRSIKGFGGSTTKNIMIGTIAWKWQDDEGLIHKFLIPKSFYVKEGNVRLLSPQHWAQTQRDTKPIQGTGSKTVANQITLFWNQRKNKLTIPLSKVNNVATYNLAPGYTKFMAFCAEAEVDYAEEQDCPIICMPAQVVSDNEDSGSEEDYDDSKQAETQTIHFDLNGQKGQNAPVIVEDEEEHQPTTLAAEMLQYHHRFGHISFRKLTEMAKLGIIPKRLAKCATPTCSACLYAKAIRKPWRSRTSPNIDEATKPKRPGECVSVDQLVSPTPGLIAQMSGFLTMKRYRYATVYVDQASRLSFVWLQKTATAEETLEGKTAFEQYAKDRGIIVQAYHADNGIFRAAKWVLACRTQGQSLTFAGVNAHHQNGIAERRIRTLQELARTMLIHANHRWPKAVTANLWPYAIRMANDVLCETPNMQHPQRLTPQQVFSNTNVNPNPKHWKPFACPVYVLDNSLQSGKGIYHKWKQRSRVGIYLGRSPQHARSVALVLDRKTGLVSPQFHIKFDPSFQTVKTDEFDSQWQLKTGFVGIKTKEPTSMTQNVLKRSTPSEGEKRNAPSEGAQKRQRFEQEPDREQNSEINRQLQRHNMKQAPELGKTHKDEQVGKQTPIPETEIRPPVERLIEAMLAEVKILTKEGIEGEIFCLEAMFPIREVVEHPLTVFKATSDPDTMYLHQAMKEPDRKEFVAAMNKEVKDQSENGNFSIEKRSSVPEGVVILPTVWQMKRKRDIKTRKVKKWKARLNIDGSRMEKGVHYSETYAPVASWNTIRMLLSLKAVHNWHTRQLDYVLAFPQAPVEKVLYLHIPRGFNIDNGDNKDYVLKVHRNIYGQKQAGRVWNKYLVNKLTEEVGFVQSKVDECVFYRGKTMYALYTDDSILAGPDKNEIDDIISDMKKAKLDITEEGELEDFLGVNIERMADGTIHLTQPHLIDQILDDLRLNNENVTTKNIPALSSKILSRHSESEKFDGSFNYKSVIGKLNYLEKSTRSDISYITHQCARFAIDPKVEHAQALKHLGRYLKATRKMGTILKPIEGMDLEVYVDADFCGNWDPKETWDVDTARSRHGYIISYAGCPVMWKSQLQTEIALSSTESEYCGLSYALRDAIPIMELLKEMKRFKFPIKTAKAKVHCKVFEDNSGALEIATVHKFRPRTKHINVKYHFFRDYINRKEIIVCPIDTTMQRADYLTKPVSYDILARLRPMVMGW